MLGLGIGSFIETSDFAVKSVGFTNSKSLKTGTNGGVNSYAVSTNYTTQNTFKDSHTFTCWMKLTTNGIQTQIPLGVFAGSFLEAVYFAVNASGIAITTVMSNNDFHTVQSNAAFESSQAAHDWAHFAVVTTRTEGASNALSSVIYRNAQVVASTQTATITDSNLQNLNLNGADPYIGAFNYEPLGGVPVGGSTEDDLYDEMSLHKAALSSDAISEIYNDGVPINLALGGTHFNASDLEFYYRFEDNLNDSSGNGHTADELNSGSGSGFSTDTP